MFNGDLGGPVSVNHVADGIGSILELPVKRNHLPPRAGDIRDSWADISACARSARA